MCLSVAAQRKERRRASSKASIARTEPIQAAAPGGRGGTGGGGRSGGGRGGRRDAAFREAWRRTAGDLSEAEQRDAVVRALQVFRLLPAGSSYAQHRIRVLEKALQLLDKARCELPRAMLHVLLAVLHSCC